MMTESSQSNQEQPDPAELARLLVFSRLDQLTLAVRDRLIPNDAATVRVWSVFMTSTNGWRRCFRFLKLILAHYKARAPLNRTAPWEVSTEEVQLDIMSFYLFAKILLDQAAEWVGFCFDYRWKKKSGSTHVALDIEFEDFINTKQLLSYPPDLPAAIKDMRERIVEYRNDLIEHPREPRMEYGLRWLADGLPSLYPMVTWPTDADDLDERQRPTEDLQVLLGAVEDYIVALVAFLERNVMASVLGPLLRSPVQPKPPS